MQQNYKRYFLISSLLLIVLAILVGYYYQTVSRLESSIDNDFRNSLATMQQILSSGNEKNHIIIQALQVSSEMDSIGKYTSFDNSNISITKYTKHLKNYFANCLVNEQYDAKMDLDSLSEIFSKLYNDPTKDSHISLLIEYTSL
ncbi:hypothetical protein [Paenibacillus ihumii]|uniref:hypothetical protein n=1 Tax=Paenibacillus ihumii TaxID=687436 RepID=UPI0006D7FBEE|nr:hypothetical protein [Paenibacillus ihumii]